MKIALATFAIMIISASAWGETLGDLSTRAHQAGAVLENNSAMRDNAIPKNLFDQAKCVATFPNVIRAGFIFGGRFGKGMVSCRVPGGWSSPVFLTLAGGSWGFQIGVDSTDLVLVFLDQNAMMTMVKSKLTLGVDGSIAAGPLGRNAVIGTDVTLRSQIFSYSRTRGLYAGLSLDGSVLAVDNDADAVVYGETTLVTSTFLANYENAPPQVWSYVEALIAAAGSESAN